MSSDPLSIYPSSLSGKKVSACQIRTSTETELPRLLELNKGAVPAVNLLNELAMRHLMSQAEYFHSLWFELKLVGFLIALAPGASYQSPNYRWFEHHYHRFLYIDRIVIDGSYQGVGFGQLLYDRLLETVEDRFTKITCEVNLRPTNERSLRFHQRYGFRQIGTQETEGGAKLVSLMELEVS